MMDFGLALIALKRGKAVARKGWNGKGMFLTLQNGSTVKGSDMRNEPAKYYYGDNNVTISPHIDMKAADGTYVVGWLASQTDMLAEDWEVVDPASFVQEIYPKTAYFDAKLITGVGTVGRQWIIR